MFELNIEQCNVVSGASHEYAEACLVGGAAVGGVGAFFSPAGAAIGGLFGCAGGMAMHYFIMTY